MVLLKWLQSIVLYFLGDFGQVLLIRSCHEDLILTRKSHNCAGTAFVQILQVAQVDLISALRMFEDGSF